MKFKIMLAPGDGIGPEIIEQAQKVLETVGKRFDHQFEYVETAVGGASIERYGRALTEETLAVAKSADAILFGAVGDPRYDDPTAEVRPEQALLGLRRELDLFANLRPVKIWDPLINDSPLKPEIVRDTDIMVIRELTSGIYFGEPKKKWKTEQGRHALNTMQYAEHEIERIAHVAFQIARLRNKRVTSVDKANVLETSQLWREVVVEVAADYPDVALEHILVDACAMHLINNPRRFDVIVTANMFGDILTDEAAMLTGSLGMMPSASLTARNAEGRGTGLYEPIHGSAPDIAGQGLANPIGMIMSAAMMLRLSFGLDEEAKAIESAVNTALEQGLRTADIARDKAKALSTTQMGDEIRERLTG